MLTIKMASEALTCLKERARQPNASPPTFSTWKLTARGGGRAVLPARFKHCSDQ